MTREEIMSGLAEILEEHEDAEGHFHLHADHADEPTR